MKYNLEEVLVERPTKTVYRDNNKTIKYFVKDYSIANILNEALNQARVEEGTDLNIPKLLEVTKIDDRWALVFEHIDEKTLQELMDENKEKEDEYLDLFVNIQLDILSNNVLLLNRIKDKYTRKINDAENINDQTKYELLERLQGMKNHTKLCHGDFNPSNIILRDDGSYHIIDWAHATQGNASADVARTFLILSMQGKDELADKYLNLFSLKSGISVKNIQNWIPIVAASQMTKGIKEEQEFLSKWISVADYQ
jgi:tRNA A-37 threonylcarbamoyl transferase component Bud32